MTSYVLDDTGRKLAEDNVYLVIYIINKYFGTSNVDLDDLVSIGNVALCCAAAEYKSDKGITFCTYASKSIINAITMEFIRMSRQKRGGNVSIISLNETAPSSAIEDPRELVDTIADDTIDIETQVTDKIIIDSIVQYVPTFMEINSLNISISEYAKRNNLPKSTAHVRVQRELNKARRVLSAGMVVA